MNNSQYNSSHHSDNAAREADEFIDAEEKIRVVIAIRVEGWKNRIDWVTSYFFHCNYMK